MKKLDKDILKTLRDYYLLSVRGMASSVDEGTEYRRHENGAAKTLRKEGLKEWDRIRAVA